MYKVNICIDCLNSVNGCAWAKNGEAVQGWTAKPTTLKINETKTINTFYITACPLFKKDTSRPTPAEVKQEIMKITGKSFLRNRREKTLIIELQKINRLDLYDKLNKARFIHQRKTRGKKKNETTTKNT